ncbi:MAG: DbpA RNA binding domain-containing protein, partial [Vicinamibacteria bacterium]
IEHAPRPRRRDHDRERPARRGSEAAKPAAGNGHVKLFVNRGERSGITEDNLRWALTEGAVIPGEQIGAIRVLERFSFVELPDEHAKVALERLDGTKLEGKQIRVEYAKD